MADTDFLPEVLAETQEPEDQDDALQAPQGLTMDQLREVLEDQNRRSEARVADALRPRQPLQSDVVAPQLEIDLNGLPDARVDFAAWQKEFTQRIAAASGKLVQNVQAQSNEQVGRQMTMQQVIAESNRLLREAAPDMPEELLDYSARQVADRMRAEGIDPSQALMRDMGSVTNDVVDYARDFLSKMGADPGRRESNGSGGRTGMLGGGRQTDSTGRRARANAGQGGRTSKDEPGDFYKELLAEQTRLRIY